VQKRKKDGHAKNFQKNKGGETTRGKPTHGAIRQKKKPEGFDTTKIREEARWNKVKYTFQRGPGSGKDALKTTCWQDARRCAKEI